MRKGLVKGQGVDMESVWGNEGVVYRWVLLEVLLYTVYSAPNTCTRREVRHGTSDRGHH